MLLYSRYFNILCDSTTASRSGVLVNLYFSIYLKNEHLFGSLVWNCNTAILLYSCHFNILCDSTTASWSNVLEYLYFCISLENASFGLHYLSVLRPAIHLSRNMRKCSQSAKNEKCKARYFASLFSHFAPGSAFAWKVKGFWIVFHLDSWLAKSRLQMICKTFMRRDTFVWYISYFYAASRDRFLVSRISNCLSVEAVIMDETKGFSRVIRDKIIERENNRITKRL